jgi:hypothetical protein
VQTPKLTRRRALGLGAAALATAASSRPSAAVAAAARGGASSFSLDLTGHLGEAGAHASGWRTLPPVRAPRRFDVLGLDFPRGAHVRAEVRARTRRGEWTRWTALPAQGDHAPDQGAAPTGTAPCWTGSADVFQVRVLGDPGRLRARFVRAAPAAAAARRLHASAAARASRSAAPRQGGVAPTIIPRAAWGGDALPPKATPDYGQVQVGFVHHTVTANAYSPEQSAGIVLGIAQYHRDHNGWNDIGYNFLVDKYGQVFEGRAGGIEQAVVGAQAQGYNSNSTGVSCLGDYTGTVLPDVAVEAVARLLAWKLPLHGVPVVGSVVVTSLGGTSNRYRSGTAVTLQRICGHRDGDLTSCPGEILYGQLDAIRGRAAALAVPVSALTATAPRNVLGAGEPLALSGALRFADGSSPATAPIQVQHEPLAGAAWTVLTTVFANPDGSWSAAVIPPSSGRVRAVFPGDGARAVVEGAPLRVTVRPTVTVDLSRSTVRRGRRIDVTGDVGPTWPQRIQLTLERHSGRGIVRVQHKQVRVRRGHFATTVRPRLRGRYRLTISADGTVKRRKLRAL